MPRVGMGLNNQLPLDLMREAVQAAEEGGYEVCWITEGIGMEAPSIIAAMSERTSRIRFGTGILIAYNRTPGLMIQMLLSLDAISDGRFILGLGAGHAPDVWDDHGIKLERPFQRLRDYLHIIREGMVHGHVSYEGRDVVVPNFSLDMAVPGKCPPIYLAALGPKMGALAGEIADGVLFNMGAAGYLEEAISGLKNAAQGVGRHPSEVEVACLLLAATGPEGERWARNHVSMYIRLPFYQKLLSRTGFASEVERIVAAWGDRDLDKLDKAAAAVSDKMLDELTLTGDPAKWWDKVEKLNKIGVDLVCPYFGPHGPGSRESVLDGLRGMAAARK